MLSIVPCTFCIHIAENQRQHNQVLHLFALLRTLKLRCLLRGTPPGMKGWMSKVTCHAPRSELLFEQLLVCPTIHETLILRATLALGYASLKYMTPSLGCKDIKCMEHRLSLVVVPTLCNCL